MFNYKDWVRDAIKSGVRLDKTAIQNAINTSGKSNFQATISVTDKVMLIAILMK